MEPVVEKLLQGVPFAGMGTTQERNGLIGVIRELIKNSKYTVEYILNYCQSNGYQRKMAEEVFEELTGLSPELIINNNEYYDMPNYIPNMCIAWGLSKTKKNVALYVVPGDYGYSIMEKNEIDSPAELSQFATVSEAVTELKKAAKKIQTLDKIITKNLLEAEDIQTSATNIHNTNTPYFSDEIRILKKNFKDKVINIEQFEREAKLLLAQEKMTVDEAEDLINWEREQIDEDDSYIANDTLQCNEEWNQIEGGDIPFEKIFEEVKSISEEDDIPNLEEKCKDLFIRNKELFEECDLLECASRLYQLLLGFTKEDILGKASFERSKKSLLNKKADQEELDVLSEEEGKTEVDEELEKIDNMPINELLEDNTPIDYFEKEIKNDKIDTINDKVSKCITQFSDKFNDFDKYDIKILSYKTKILAPYTPNQDEMIEDKEINADAILQIILAVNNKADIAEIKKLLAVFSVTDGKMHWAGTVRDENDKIVAFTEQGLDLIFDEEII